MATLRFNQTLAIMIAYCAVAMIFAWQQFFKVFEIGSTWRKVIYWMITVYIAGSVPGYISFLMFGNTAYFDFFPWWFSVILLFAYGAIIAYFFSLKPGRIIEKV